MNVNVKVICTFKTLKTLSLVLLGVFFIGLMAFKKMPIPATSLQMSLQSLSISILVIMLGKKAFWVVLLYLILATLGFPILAEGVSNTRWYLLPSAGYYFGFLISSFLFARILIANKPKQFFKAWLIFSCNESLILLSGYFVLSLYLGPIKAWWIGVWPFLLGALLKITLATCLYWMLKIWRRGGGSS